MTSYTSAQTARHPPATWVQHTFPSPQPFPPTKPTSDAPGMKGGRDEHAPLCPVAPGCSAMSFPSRDDDDAACGAVSAPRQHD